MEERAEGAEGEQARQASLAFYSIAALYGVGIIWLASHAIMAHDIATLFSLAAYTIIGMALYVRGLTKSSGVLRVAGELLMGFVVIRLLLVDVWQLPMPLRIVTFFLIGVLLISTAFMHKRT